MDGPVDIARRRESVSIVVWMTTQIPRHNSFSFPKMKYWKWVLESKKWNGQHNSKVRFLYQCSDHLSHSKNFTSLFPLTFLSKHISLYALGRLKWILDIIWPLNQHFKLKNQRNWLKQVRMWKFWNVMNCILLHW